MARTHTTRPPKSTPKAGRRRRAREGDGPTPWERFAAWPVVEQVRPMVAQVRALMDSVWSRPAPPDPGVEAAAPSRAARAPRRERPRTLPFDVYLNLGMRSVKLFAAGPLDPFCFFQRCSVSEHHDVEFLARLDPEHAGTEEYKPYGLIRLRPSHAQPVPTLQRERAFWETLHEDYGLARIPLARSLVPNRSSAYDPRDGDRKSGLNGLTPPKSGRVFQRVGRRRYTHADMLEVLRREMTSLQAVAWIEEAFSARPVEGQILQRYYLTPEKQVVVVRDHWARGKSLFRSETSAEAQQICEASGYFGRPGARLAA